MPFARFRRALPVTLLLVLSVPLATRGAPLKVPEGFEVRLVATVPAVLYPLPGRHRARRLAVRRRGPDGPGRPLRGVRRPDPPVPRGQGAGRLRRRLPRHLRHGLARRHALRLAHALPLRDPRRRRRRQGRRPQGPVQGPRARPTTAASTTTSSRASSSAWTATSTSRSATRAIPKATGPDGRTIQLIGGGIVRCRPDGTGHRGRLLRHPQPPRAQPRRPRQPLHLRQHRRRPRLVDPGHPPHRRRLLRLSLRLPRRHVPDAPPDGRVRRRLPLRRRSSTTRTPGPRSTGASASGPSGARARSRRSGSPPRARRSRSPRRSTSPCPTA